MAIVSEVRWVKGDNTHYNLSSGGKDLGKLEMELVKSEYILNFQCCNVQQNSLVCLTFTSLQPQLETTHLKLINLIMNICTSTILTLLPRLFHRIKAI